MLFGEIFAISLTNFIFKPGTIKNLFLSILSIAYFATCSDVYDGSLNFTPATLLKFVSTGPGQSTLIFTFDFSFFSSSLIPSDNLTTYAFEE